MVKGNKKGFTLVEIIVAIGVLVIATTIFAVNMIKINNNNKDKEYQNFVNTVKSSADAYLSTNKVPLRGLYTVHNVVYIKIGDIINAGYLLGDLKNPKTGETIKDNEYVKIQLGENDELIITYPTVKEVTLKELAFAYALDNDSSAPRIKVNVKNINWEFFEIYDVNDNKVTSGRVDDDGQSVSLITSEIIKNSGTYKVNLYQYDGKFLKTSNEVEINYVESDIIAKVVGDGTIKPVIEIEANFKDIYSGDLYNAETNEIVDWTYGPSYPIFEDGTYKVCFGPKCSNEVTVNVEEAYVRAEVKNNGYGVPYIVASTNVPSYNYVYMALYDAQTNKEINYIGDASYIPVTKTGSYYIKLEYSYDYNTFWDIKSNTVSATLIEPDSSYINLEVIDNGTCSPYIIASTNFEAWDEWYLFDNSNPSTPIESGGQQEMPYAITTGYITKSGKYHIEIYSHNDTNSRSISSSINISFSCSASIDGCDESFGSYEQGYAAGVNNYSCGGEDDCVVDGESCYCLGYYAGWNSMFIRDGECVYNSACDEEYYNGYFNARDEFVCNGNSNYSYYANNGYDECYLNGYLEGWNSMVNEYPNCVNIEGDYENGWTCEGDVQCSSQELQTCRDSECYTYWEMALGSLGVVCESGIGCYDSDRGFIYSGTEDFDDSAYYEENFGEQSNNNGCPDWICG